MALEDAIDIGRLFHHADNIQMLGKSDDRGRRGKPTVHKQALDTDSHRKDALDHGLQACRGFSQVASLRRWLAPQFLHDPPKPQPKRHVFQIRPFLYCLAPINTMAPAAQGIEIGIDKYSREPLLGMV